MWVIVLTAVRHTSVYTSRCERDINYSKIITGLIILGGYRSRFCWSYYLAEIRGCCRGSAGKPTDDMISPFSNDTELIHKGSRELD